MKNWCRHCAQHRRHDGCILHLSRAAVKIARPTDHLCYLSFDCRLFSVTGQIYCTWKRAAGLRFFCLTNLLTGEVICQQPAPLWNWKVAGSWTQRSARVNVCCSGVNFKARAVLMCLPASVFLYMHTLCVSAYTATKEREVKKLSGISAHTERERESEKSIR